MTCHSDDIIDMHLPDGNGMHVLSSPGHSKDQKDCIQAYTIYKMGIIQGISEAERAFILEGVSKDVRCDGRRQKETRDAEIKCGVIAQAAGSARVRLGGTDVIVGVKAEIATPDVSSPELGCLEFSVECSPLASPAFRGRGGDELSAELASAIEKSYCVDGNQKHGDSPIDLSSLCILPGKSCWVLYIDALVLDIDGSVIDAISIACRAALQDARIPKVEIQQDGDDEDFEVDDDPEQATRLDVSRVPLSLSVGLLGSSIVLDLTGSEEEASTSVVSVSVNPQGQICGISKHRGQGIPPPLIMDMISTANTQLQQRHKEVATFLDSILLQSTE